MSTVKQLWYGGTLNCDGKCKGRGVSIWTKGVVGIWGVVRLIEVGIIGGLGRFGGVGRLGELGQGSRKWDLWDPVYPDKLYFVRQTEFSTHMFY